jgi:hypothetical protein
MGEYSLSQALKQFLDRSRLKGQVQALQIEDVWEEIMGKTISKYTEKLELVNQTLFITTSVAPLKQELQFQKEKIIQRVNETFGSRVISEVVIR